MSAVAKTGSAVTYPPDAPIADVRARLSRHLDELADEDLFRLAEDLLPEEFGGEPHVQEPLMFTVEESEARLARGIAELEARNTIPWEDVKARLRAKMASRVQG